MSTRYVPGSAAVLVGDRGVVATAREHAHDLTALVGADLVVLAVIDSLSRGSLANLPDFACAVVDGADLRIVVRGGFVARVGDQSWSGDGVATWREQTIAGGAGRDVVIEAAEGADAAGGPELPVTAGIVLASRATWTSSAAGARGAGSSTPAEVGRDTDETLVEVPGDTQVEVPREAHGEAPGEVRAETLAEPVETLGEPVETLGEQAGPGFPPPAFPPPAFPPPSFPPPPGAAGPLTPASTSLDPEVTVTESDLALDAMFGATVTGDAPETPAIPAAPAAAGDHDGRTITAAQLKALREQAARQQPAVQAVVVLPDGGRHAVQPRLLIGRRPQARQVSTTEVPTLVTVSDPYVSSTHLEAAVVDGRVVVTDLSTNGTLIVRPGQAPEQLTKGVATEVSDGTRLSLSDDLTVSVEVRADAGAGG